VRLTQPPIRRAIGAHTGRQHDIAAAPTYIEAGTKLGARALDTAHPLEETMLATARGLAGQRRRKRAIGRFEASHRGASINALGHVDIDIEHPYPGAWAGRHSDHCVRPPRPPGVDLLHISGCVLEAMWRERMLVGWIDGKYGHAVACLIERGR